MKRKYLTVEEQFKEVLNNEEIGLIEDLELREIRSKYWLKYHQAFLDENGIPDNELGNVTKKIQEQERIDIEKYIKRKELNFSLKW